MTLVFLTGVKDLTTVKVYEVCRLRTVNANEVLPAEGVWEIVLFIEEFLLYLLLKRRG